MAEFDYQFKTGEGFKYVYERDRVNTALFFKNEKMEREYIPTLTIGGGITLGGLLIGQIVAIPLTDGAFTPVAVATFLSTVPFIMILVGGGYWLDRSDLPPDRYPRIIKWLFGGSLFLVLLFAVIAFAAEDTWLVRFGILHWAVSLGAGTGFLVGIFEARTVESTLKAEHTRIRNEELRKQNERLDTLASTISHDLRNPLSVVEGNVELLREDYDDDRFDTIVEMLGRIDQIIDDTLTLARSGQVIGDVQSVALDEIVDQCWRSVETETATLQIKEGRTITADPDRIRHLFENLFRNAVEHGGEDVTVQVGSVSDGFYVEDDGSGIPTEDCDSVFDAGYSTSDGGTGFGLAIVTQIVEAHGWEMFVTEGTDGGARFEITGVSIGE